MVESLGVIYLLGVLAMARGCVDDICLLGILIIIMFLVMVCGLLLVLWLSVWHVLVVDLSVCWLIILLGRVLCVSSLVILLGVIC